MFKVSVSSEEIRQDTLFKRGDKDGQKLLINAVSFSLVADISQKVKTLDPVLYDPSQPHVGVTLGFAMCSPPGLAFLVEQGQVLQDLPR